MKNLKLTLIVAMLAVVSVASAQMRLGIKAGVNMSNIYGEDVKNTNMKIGFNAGLSADYDFAPNVALQTGLFASTKGFKYNISTLEYTSNLVYVQLPLHLAYKIDVTPGTKVFLHGGPYAAYGVGGKNSVAVGSLGGSSDKVFGDGLAQLKPFDAGLGIGAGFELGQVVIDLGWDMGLINLSNASSGTIKTQNAYLSLGYKF